MTRNRVQIAGGPGAVLRHHTRTRAPTFWLYTHDADSMSVHFVQFQIQGGALPCLRQTGEGILLEFVRRPPGRGDTCKGAQRLHFRQRDDGELQSAGGADSAEAEEL